MNFKCYNLIPANGRKSFYGKAKVIIKDGNQYLVSYETLVCGIDNDGSIHRFYDRKTNTTCCHIKSFLGEANYCGFWSLPLEKKPNVTISL